MRNRLQVREQGLGCHGAVIPLYDHSGLALAILESVSVQGHGVSTENPPRSIYMYVWVAC